MLYFHTFMFARWRDNFPAHTDQSQRSCDWYAVIGRYDISLGLSLTACVCGPTFMTFWDDVGDPL